MMVSGCASCAVAENVHRYNGPQEDDFNDETVIRIEEGKKQKTG
jgi:hypothetical protein